MSSRGQIRWSKLRPHLDVLLPGWSYSDGDHFRFVYFGGVRARLPKGAHGRRDPEIELGHIKHFFRRFGKLDEARRAIPQLR